LTPHVTIFVDEFCQVPMDFVREGTLTLNLSPTATGHLDIGNEWVTMNARFGGVPRELIFPVNAVIAIYARENGAGMEFSYETTAPVGGLPESIAPDLVTPVLTAVDSLPDSGITPSASSKPTVVKPRSGRPNLQRIK
jgi:stringent starvation protein B